MMKGSVFCPSFHFDISWWEHQDEMMMFIVSAVKQSDERGNRDDEGHHQEENACWVRKLKCEEEEAKWVQEER